MPDDPPRHGRNSWGQWTPELLDRAFPDGPAWRDAVRHAWHRTGGTDAEFASLFPHLHALPDKDA